MQFFHLPTILPFAAGTLAADASAVEIDITVTNEAGETRVWSLRRVGPLYVVSPAPRKARRKTRRAA